MGLPWIQGSWFLIIITSSLVSSGYIDSVITIKNLIIIGVKPVDAIALSFYWFLSITKVWTSRFASVTWLCEPRTSSSGRIVTIVWPNMFIVGDDETTLSQMMIKIISYIFKSAFLSRDWLREPSSEVGLHGSPPIRRLQVHLTSGAE